MTCRHRLNRKDRRPDCRNAFAQTGAWLALCIVVSPALAQEEPSAPEGYIELGFGQTDNLNRDAEELESDIGRLAVGFAGRTDRRWLRAALAGDIEYRKYGAEELSDDDDDEVLGSVDGALELHAVPDRVQWGFGFSYGQVRIDTFGAVGPSNRQSTTAVSTGPQINLPMGERTLLQVGGTISEQSFEVTRELDGRMTAGRLGLERQIDPVTQLTFAFDVSEIEYDLDGQTHDIATLSLEYRRELASGEAFASLGRGRVEIDDDSEPVTVARLVWNRAIGTRSRIEICAGREITDAGSAFAGAGVAVGCPGDLSGLASVARTTDNREQGGISTTNPFVRAGGSLSFQVDSELGRFRATFSKAQDRFQGESEYDNDSTIFEVSGSREFAHHWRAELAARLWIQDFIELGDKNEDQSVRLSLSRLLARNMRLTLSFDRNRRVGGIGPFDANEYFLSFGRDFGR